MITNVIDTTENCRYCLMCRHVCPVGHVTRKETLTPHGWGLTIASLRRGLLELNNEVVDIIYSCADCGTCRANCVTDQPLPSAIAAMRSEIAGKGLAPKAAVDVHQKLLEWQNPYVEEKPRAVSGRGKVALFVGDDALYLGSESLDAAVKLLEAVGFSPVMVGVGRNNGYLASSLGFPQTASRLVQDTFDEVEACGADSLFVLTPGDFYAFTQMREDRLEVDLPDGLTVLDVLPFLAEQLNAGNLAFQKLEEPATYAYVDPTHSVRVTTRYDAPRQLLSAVLPGQPQELFWRRERAHPLGHVALQYTNPHIATHLNYARLADASERGIQLLITEDPAGLAQMAPLASRFRLKVQGLYPLLAQQLS